MFKNRKGMIEKKNDLITRAEEIVNAADAEKRELTEDEAMELAEIRDDVKKIKEKLMMMDEIDAGREKERKPAEAKPEGDPEVEVEMEQRAIAQRDEEAFENYIRGVVSNTRAGDPINLTETAGGAMIPKTIARRIIEEVYNICPILERSTKYNTKGELVIPYYDEDTTAITVGFAQEFVELSSTVGTFTGITLKDYLAGALTLVSRSLINNSDINLTDFVVRRMALNISRFLENVLLNGGVVSGAGTLNEVKVLGLSTATVGVTTAAATAITADDLIDLQGSIKDIFQQNAIWIMHTNTRTALRKLKDEVGRYLLQDDISAAFGKTLLGKDVYVSDNMPEMEAGKIAIYYGDMRGLATKFSEDMNIQVLREKYATMHAIGVVGWVDFDSQIENQQAIAALKMGSGEAESE
ncbi:phage major capsid protein [Clostridioides difficile]|uniref:phage major capsid protein n=1 Tax=Clostridioides difficile TaxID=1496 RepID=UPI0023593D37|nr:phage major capsid protein [Clostridioides difficile]MDC9367144.1 phage major capsid protein [Clostridioides difficile]